MEWQQPHWSGRPQPKTAPRPRLRPNGFARIARFSAEHATLLILLYVTIAMICAGLAAAMLVIDPDRAPRIPLDAGTQHLEAELERRFPNIEQTFLAVVESRDPEMARAQAVALAASLSKRKDLYRDAFVPGAGSFYATNALLFRPVEEVRARVDQLLQMQPLYQALAAAPDITGFAALVSQIGKAVEQGRSPPGLEALLGAAAAAIEGEVRGKPRPIHWAALAGLGGEAQSPVWFVVATPMLGLERQAASFARQSSDGMQGVSWLWPRRALAAPFNSFRDFTVPAGLSVFVAMTLLAAGLGSFRQALAVLLPAAVALSAAALAAAALGQPLDAATWSFAAAVLAPVISSGTVLCLAYDQARARGLSALQGVMMAAHRKGALASVITLLFMAVWMSWLIRQLPSLSQFAMIAIAGAAVAWAMALTLLPALLVLLDRRARPREIHWLDDLLAAEARSGARHALDIAAMLVIALAVFGAAFLPAVRFGDRVIPAAPGPMLQTPDARGAAHILARPEDVPRLVATLSSLREAVGAIRTVNQFLPPDAAAKAAELRRLAALQPFDPAPRSAIDEEALKQGFEGLEQELAAIVAAPSASPALKDPVTRLRRAVTLFASAGELTAARVMSLEKALFGSLGEASSLAARLAALQEPGIADLDPQLRSRFVAADGVWRIEVMPRDGVGVLTFAAALRRAVPETAGEPIASLVRNEIFHHETLLALGFAAVAAAVVVLAGLRSLTGFAAAMLPGAAFVTLTAALSVLLGIGFNAAMLAGASAAAALLIASAMTAGESFGPLPQDGASRPSPAPRAALLPPLVLAGAVAPLAISSRPAVAEFGLAMALLLILAAVLGLLLVPALTRWLARFVH